MMGITTILKIYSMITISSLVTDRVFFPNDNDKILYQFGYPRTVGPTDTKHPSPLDF